MERVEGSKGGDNNKGKEKGARRRQEGEREKERGKNRRVNLKEEKCEGKRERKINEGKNQ